MTYTSMIPLVPELVMALVLQLVQDQVVDVRLGIATFFCTAYLSDIPDVVMAIVSLLMLGGMLMYVRKWHYRTFLQCLPWEFHQPFTHLLFLRHTRK